MCCLMNSWYKRKSALSKELTRRLMYRALWRGMFLRAFLWPLVSKCSPCLWSLEKIKEYVPGLFSGTRNKETKICVTGDFPGSPVVKTPSSQCKGHGFDPSGWGTKIPHAAQRGLNKQTNKQKTCITGWWLPFMLALVWAWPPLWKALAGML